MNVVPVVVAGPVHPQPVKDFLSQNGASPAASDRKTEAETHRKSGEKKLTELTVR
jgi:hypothetical protein